MIFTENQKDLPLCCLADNKVCAAQKHVTVVNQRARYVAQRNCFSVIIVYTDLVVQGKEDRAQTTNAAAKGQKFLTFELILQLAEADEKQKEKMKGT